MPADPQPYPAQPPSALLRHLYLQHRQGAWFRAGASAIMATVAWVASGLGHLTDHQLIGVMISVAVLILMNPPTLWVLARSANLRFIKYFSLGINLFEVIVYTAIIHVMGGLAAAYLCVLYFILIGYLGVAAPRRIPFLIAGWSLICLLGMVILEQSGLLPLTSSPTLEIAAQGPSPLEYQLVVVGAVGVLLMVMAYVSSHMAGLLRQGRHQLREINVELEQELDQRRRDQEELRRAKDELETRVAERTADLLELNRKLTEEMLERKQTELALRENQVRYALAAEAGRVGVWEWDLTTDEFHLDPFIKQRLGYEEDELHQFTREWFTRVTHPEERQQWIDLALLISQGRINTFENEYRVVAKDGDIQWILTRGSVVRDEASTPQRVVGTSMEITKRKRTEEALQKSEARYALATEAARIGVWDWDLATGRFESDPLVWKQLGYEPDQIKELTTEWAGRVVHPDDRLRWMEIAVAVQQGQLDAFENEFRARHVDGRYTWYLIRGSVVRDGSGRPTRLVGLSMDIDDRKQAEQERDRLIHELREALDKVQTLRGLIPICAYCKKIRDDEGYWHQVEAYVKAHSEAEFSHGLCPDCIRDHYPDYATDPDTPQDKPEP